ncbi:MAG: hypothetical protein ACO29O_01395 [Chitinophagaceae bacterium]
MKKLFIILVSFFMVFNTNAQFETAKQIYSSPQLPELLSNAKSVAILPFKVSISYKRMPKGMTSEMIRQNELEESTQMQQGMFTYLLRKSDDYTVSFQEVDRTNALLKKEGVYDHLDEILADSICKILKVDAIIRSNWTYAKTGSEAGAIATAVLIGVSKPTASGQLVMQIYGNKTGELAWRMSKEMNESAFSSANELMERMMRKVGRNFPFEKPNSK